MKKLPSKPDADVGVKAGQSGLSKLAPASGAPPLIMLPHLDCILRTSAASLAVNVPRE